MKSKKIKFDFTPEEIKFVKALQLKGAIDSSDKEEMKRIFQSKIDPTYDPCAGCHNLVKANFKRLVQLVCESVGVDDLRYYRPIIQTDLKTQSEVKEVLKAVEQPKEDSILKKVGKALKG